LLSTGSCSYVAELRSNRCLAALPLVADCWAVVGVAGRIRRFLRLYSLPADAGAGLDGCSDSKGLEEALEAIDWL